MTVYSCSSDNNNNWTWHCAHVHREVIVNGNDEEVEGVPPLVDPDRSTRPTIKGVIVNGNDEAADKTS